VPEPAAALLPLVEQAPVGIALWDLDLRYVLVNRHLAQINGLPVEAHLGRRIPEVLPGLAAVEETLRTVLRTGEPAVGRRVLGRLPGYEHPRWRLASYFPVRDEDGGIVGVGAVISDVTDQVRLEETVAQARDARERERAILEQVVAQVPVGIAVSWGPQHHYVLVNDRGRAMIPARGELIGRTPLELYPELGEAVVEETYTRTFRTGETVVREELEVPFAGDEGFEGSRFYDVTFAPVRQGEEVAGVVVTFVEVTERVRERVELQRELDEEHRLTGVLQRALLPPALPAPPGLGLAARYEPARHAYEVGGDFYDVVAWDDERWLLVLGDVSGKGPRAAAVSAVARSALRTALHYEDDLAGLTASLDRVLRRELGGAGYVTLALVALAPAPDGGRSAEVVLAGHPQPLLLDASGARPVGVTGPALCALPAPAWPVERLTLGVGDALLLYTDGLVEARRPHHVTPEELAVTAMATGEREPGRLVDALYDALVGGASGGPDDVALLVAHVLPAPKPIRESAGRTA